MTHAITVNNLEKTYRVPQKEPGFIGSLRSLVARRYQTVQAVKKINLHIEEGELIGFIGPNGAGKTTTLKMLSGLLYPTSGEVSVLGHKPWEREQNFLRRISLVMGQKHQLVWDLPLADSLLLQRDIYELSDSDYQANLDELTKLLELEEFIKTPVRKLSLGQRMRGELAAALIYHPSLLFLDEPTIGLDVVAQKKVREFIATYQAKYGATIILTSHYLDDVRELCKRLVMIDHGSIVFDGATEELINKHVDHKRIVLILSKPVSREEVSRFGHIIEYQPLKTTLQVPRAETSKQAAALLTQLPVEDISIEEPSLEDVVRELFTKKDYA